ncbi:sulfite exporter TauE/SafE family protein [Stenotrophomonas acidaminiphila]|uniref:sulfite exporter TauE/SafE family protein n=1 Tax=Stenotrophomonas acidaminiphila TaxID=128780 RepID=UPI000AA3C2D7|nr:sulfite exporter TauE/SafE family protein [Stenotrophomonas acidaminiphila]
MLPLDIPVLTAAFVAGLLGGLHCAVMCGGIATGFPAMAPGRALGVAWQANLGRVTGYTVAGALAGGLGGGILRLARSDTLALGVRVAAGLALVLLALRLLGRGGRLDLLARPGQQLWQWLRPLHRHLLPADRAWRRLALGALWGWMPCGLSLSLLSVAWLQANALGGALVMAVFGLATLPVMVPLTWSGARMGRGLQRPGLRVALAGFILAAGLLTIAAPWLMQVPALHGVLSALGCQPLQSR